MKIHKFVPTINDLSDTKRAILAFCERPKTIAQISEYLGITIRVVQEHMRELARLDLIDRKHEDGKSHNHGITWQTTNKPLFWDSEHMTMKGRTRIMGVWL
jgi:predicted ArsR family transcriptional regulator